MGVKVADPKIGIVLLEAQKTVAPDVDLVPRAEVVPRNSSVERETIRVPSAFEKYLSSVGSLISGKTSLHLVAPASISWRTPSISRAPDFVAVYMRLM
jgi:hypothetical protein